MKAYVTSSICAISSQSVEAESNFYPTFSNFIGTLVLWGNWTNQTLDAQENYFHRNVNLTKIIPLLGWVLMKLLIEDNMELFGFTKSTWNTISLDRTEYKNIIRTLFKWLSDYLMVDCGSLNDANDAKMAMNSCNIIHSSCDL